MDFRQTFPYFAGERILYVHGFGSSGATRTASLLRQLLPEAEVLSPDLPLTPAEMLPFLTEYAERERPALVIGTSMGAMLAEKLRGVDRICVNPALHIDQSIGQSLKFGDFAITSPRADGVTTISVTKALAKEFAAVCAHNFEGLDAADARRMVGLFGRQDDTVDCREEFARHYSQSIPFAGGHRLTDHTLLHAVMPVVRQFHNRRHGIEPPRIVVGLDALRDAEGRPRSSARLAVETLAQHYDLHFLGLPAEQPQAWLEEHIGVEAWNREVLTAHPETLFADYLITASAAAADAFAGTPLLFGSPEFKTWEALLDYFEHLGGQ